MEHIIPNEQTQNKERKTVWVKASMNYTSALYNCEFESGVIVVCGADNFGTTARNKAWSAKKHEQQVWRGPVSV